MKMISFIDRNQLTIFVAVIMIARMMQVPSASFDLIVFVTWLLLIINRRIEWNIEDRSDESHAWHEGKAYTMSMIPSPGMEDGPCGTTCNHEDCEELRTVATARCYDCGEPIGYQRDFILRSPRKYILPDQDLVHVHCPVDQGCWKSDSLKGEA
jgi:hypothetical protein